MTDKERAIVMAYTGYAMLTGDKIKIFLDYVNEKTGNKYTIDDMKYKAVSDLVSKSAFNDFVALCD